jgi:hypothetical protein
LQENEKVSIGANKVNDLLQQSTDLSVELWFDYVVFSWRWWIVSFLTIVPWMIWWKYRKKFNRPFFGYAKRV